MKEKKRLALRLFLVAEVLVFGGFYLFGSQGIKTLMRLQSDIQGIDREMQTLKEEIVSLEGHIAHYEGGAENQTQCFYKLQEARKLQMAFPDEEIYLMN